jgi:hypothetical protein
MIRITFSENFDRPFTANDVDQSPTAIIKNVVSVTNRVGILVTIRPEVVSRTTSRAGNLHPTNSLLLASSKAIG